MNANRKNKSGQAILFLMVVLLIGTVAVLWNFNLHRGIVTKMRMRDAGDSAALMAARWQGVALNTIGELNLVQAVLVSDAFNPWLPNPNEALETEIGSQLRQIENLRQRVALHGPLIGFAAAQQMALNNRIHANKRYTHWYQNLYFDLPDEGSSKYEMAQEYMDLLWSISQNGIAVKANAVHAYHILWDERFYDAIASGYYDDDWCLFYFNPTYYRALKSYNDPDYFPPLPEAGGYTILDIDVGTAYGSLSAILNNQTNANASVRNDFADYLEETRPEEVDYQNLMDANADSLSWGVFGSKWNQSWSKFIATNQLPYRSEVLPQYDYMGPESIFELYIDFDETDQGAGAITSRDESNVVTNWFDFDKKSRKAINRPRVSNRRMRWASAAKIFGSIDQGAGNDALPPTYFGLVLPVFTDARLIPVQRRLRDIDTDPNHDWVHLTKYLKDGLEGIDADGNGYADSGCRDCNLLLRFDNPKFREEGLEWLSDPTNFATCISYDKGDSGGGARGAPYGH